MSYRSFEELEIWKRACALAVRIYNMMKGCRDYAFKDQMMRAALSIASNIAEGAERLESGVHSFPEYRKGINRGTEDTIIHSSPGGDYSG